MDDKKLLQLHTWLKEQGGTSRTFDDFKAKANSDNGKALHGFLQSEGYTDLDYNGFIGEYSAPTQPQTVVGNFMQGAQDLAANALQQKAESDARNEAVSQDIKKEQVRQKPTDYYTQNIPQVHAEFKNGEPQNLQSVMSPNNPKLSGEVLFKKEKAGAYESATDNREPENLVEKNPKIIENPKTQLQEITTPKYPSDVIGLGMKQRDERIKETSWLLKNAITGNQGEDNWTGDMGIAANLHQLDPEKVTDVGADALKYAQNNEIPYEIATAIKKGDDKVVGDYLRVHDDDFAKKVYNEGDRNELARLSNKNPQDITPEERLNFWHEKTKGLSKIDMPETLPYQLVANDSKTLKEQLDLIGNLFEEKTGAKPETTEQAVAAMPKSFAQEFPNPNEQIYAYYQVLGNRFQELTRELAKEYPIGTQAQKISLKEDTEGIKSLIGTRLAFLGVEDLKDPKWVEYMRVLNKIHALAPLIQKGQAGKAEGEWGDEPIYGGDIGVNALLYAKSGAGKLAASMWSGVGDMLGYDVLKTNQENIAREQQNTLSQTGGQITPQQQKVLDERMSTEGFFNPKSWGAQGASLVGMGVIMSSNPFAGELQAAGKGLQMLNKGSKLFNSEQKLTRLGKVVQGAVGLTAAGLETEIAGQVSGEGESVTDELSFGMGVAGEAGKLALGAVIGLIGKGATKITPKALVAQVEKQYGKLSPSAQKAVENYGTNIGNRVGNAFGKELPEEVFQTGYENYKKYGLDGMMSATIRDIMGEDRNWNTAMRWVAQIAIMGALDGQPDTDNYKLQTWAVTMAEKFSGQKVNADLVNEFVDKMRKETQNVPTGVKFKDNGVDFTLNNTQFSYTDGKIQVVGGKSVDTELQNKAAEVGEKMTNGYQAAVQNGDFNPLFGIDVANKTKEEVDAARAEQGGQSVKFDNTDENTNLQQNEQQNPTISQPQEAPEAQAAETIAPTDQNQGEVPQVTQETPEVENAEAVQEPADVEAAEVTPTAEELDVRRGEIQARLPEIKAELETISAKDIDNITEEDVAKEDELLMEQAQLQSENDDIAEQRKTILTKEEAEQKVEAQRLSDIKEKTARIKTIDKDINELVKSATTTAEKFAAKTKKQELLAEKEVLTTELEALQPKKIETEKPTVPKKESVEKPIMAETPQLETPISESKGEINPTPAEKVEKLPEVTTSEESVTEKIGDKNPFSDTNLKNTEKRIEGITESNKAFTLLLRLRDWLKANPKAKISFESASGKFMSDGGEGVKSNYVSVVFEGKKDAQNRYITFKTKDSESSSKLTQELSAILKEYQEFQENELIFTEIEKPTDKQQAETESKPQEKETPVAPAAPKEEKPQPEKAVKPRKEVLKKTLPPAPKKETSPAPPQKVNNGKELAQMLGGDEKAVETGNVWGKVAERWAKRTGKTEQDWWNRIESIQVGGEKAGAKGLVEIVNDKFVVFLASDRDVSTPMHELAHIFQTDLSASENKSVVDWYNEKNGTNHSVSDWGFAETPTSRKISEYFAEGFIEWLKEGSKATDKAMQPIFDKFKEWLKGVVNTVFDAKVELNDTMRGIYEDIFTEKEKQEIEKKQKSHKNKLIDEDATDPEQLVWNYFAKGGQINKQDVIDRFSARNKGVVPTEKMKHINNSAYISETAKTKQQIAKDLFDSQTGEKEYSDKDYFAAVDAVVDEMGAGFSKVVDAKIKEYADIKYQNQDEEAINAQTEDAIEQAKINRPSEAERLRMKYENEIDAEIGKGAGLFQKSDYRQQIIDWSANSLREEQDDIEGAKKDLREILIEQDYFSEKEIGEILDTAEKVSQMGRQTNAERVLSEHAEKIEQKRNEIIEQENQSLPQDTIDALREEVKKIAETITDSTTQEEVAQMQSETKDMLVSKGMSQKDAQELVEEFIRERSFGTKFRDNYAPQMSQELRDAVMKQTYFYRVVSNSAAIQKAEAKINEWYEEAIANVAQRWHDDGQKPDATSQDFIADTYEELMDIVNNALFNQKITADYYVKVAAAMYAIKLADTLVGNLTATAKKRVLDKTVTLVNNLAELGNFLGRSINMFGVMANVSGGVLQAIFKKEMANIISNMSFSQKVNKDAIEAVLDGVADMVQSIANGTNKPLIQSLVNAMEGNKSVEKLLEKIVENATNEQDIIDILNKIDDLEIQKEALKKEIRDKLVLEAKIREKNKEIAQLRAALAAKKPATGTTNKNTQRQKSAAKTKYDSLIDEVVSFGKNLFSNSLYQTIEGFQTSMFTTYKPEVITKVNDIMKNIADFVYLGNENVSTEKLYEMVQDAARKEFAQKYLEKANIQPDVPLITGTDLTKAQEAKNKAAIAKNKEKENQKQLHKDILDAINNDHFKASIETYLQENQAKDIRAQMRKRVTGIVNDTNATPTEKKVELRKALVQMVGEAATSTNEAAKGIKDFMRTYFDVTGKDVTAFEAEFDKMWAAQVEKKQLDLIKKRLQTSAEKDAALTEKVINDLIKHFKTNKEFGHKFSEDLAKNIRITEKNWTDETAKRFRDTYHIPISMAHNQKKVADMIKYIDTLPNGTDAKEMAMNVVMNEYLNIVGVSNLDRWVALVDVMFHVDNLLNIPTMWQNIKDSLYQVAHDTMLPVANFFGEVITAMIDKENFLTALSKAQKANWINAKVVFKTLFSQSTRRLAQNQFSLQEARAVGEYASFMDYFAKSFTELPNSLKKFKFNNPVDFIQYGIPAALMVAYDTTRLGVITNALMSGPDLALGNALQMGRMANILSRKGINSKEAMDLADISTAGDRELDYGGKMQKISDILAGERDKGYFANQETVIKTWNEAIASGKTEEQAHNAIKQAVADGTITSDYKREWRRKMELFAEYVEQEHAAWIIADTYRRNATYKTDPTGLLGMAYQGITTGVIRSTRQNEIDARERYKRDKTALNLAKQKGWQQAKLVPERILGGAYLRTKINLANKYLLNSFLGNLATHIKNNVGYMDTDAAMKLSVNDKGEIKPNSLWYIDDLTNKGFLKEAENKLQADIDAINKTASDKKEAITEKEDAQIEKIDNTISDKERALNERKAAIDKVSDKKQESIDKKINKRTEIVDNLSKRIQAINSAFAEKRKKIVATTQAKTERLKSKMLGLLTSEIKLIDAAYGKKARVENAIRDYTNKWEKLSTNIMLIAENIESEKEAFQSALNSLNAVVNSISEQLGVEDKIDLMTFAAQKESELLEKIGGVVEFSSDNQDSIEREIGNRKDIFTAFQEKIQEIQELFSDKEQKILDDTKTRTEGLKAKMIELLTSEMRLVDAAYDKKVRAENAIRDYTDKWEKLSVDIMLIAKKIQSEKEGFNTAIKGLKEQVDNISKNINGEDKAILMNFAEEKEKQLLDLYEKRANPLNLMQEKMLAEKEKIEMQFDLLLKEYKTKHENSAETIRKGVDRTIKEIEKNIEVLAQEKDVKIQENTVAKNEAIQKVAEVVKKRISSLDLYEKRINTLVLTKEKMLIEKEKTEMQFDSLLDEYKEKHENSAEIIRTEVDKAIKEIEKNIEALSQERDVKIQENTVAQNEMSQKALSTANQRVAAIDHELNVAINVEKEKYNRQKAYLDGVFAKEKAQLEQEKAVIARKAEADRNNINKLAADKAKPIIAQKAKIANKIASYDANYRIGYADEKARQVRIGITTALLLASYLFSSGDDDDEEKPIIEVVGDITGADGGTKASNQNSKEANSKKKLIIRAFGQQLSFNFMDKANVMDLLAWGEVFDHLARKKRGIVSDKSIVDVAARPMLTFMQQIFAFRDASTLDFTNPFKEPSENVLKAASNLSPVKMPAQVRQIISDFVYNGQQYDLPDNETYFKQYLRLLGVHPEALSNEDAKYAVRYSMVNGQPLHQYSGDNSNEINRLIATGIWGKETSTSFNDLTIKPDKTNVLFKEMEFLSWLHDRGLTSAINITNPDDIAPKVVGNILLGTNPMPVDEFQENILKPTAVQASDKLRKMYRSGKYGTKNSEGYYVEKTEKDIILSVKNLKIGEEAAKDYLESNKTDLAALNIGLKYITKDLWENTKKEVLMKYLKEKKPNYKRPGETYTTYKNRVKLK